MKPTTTSCRTHSRCRAVSVVWPGGIQRELGAQGANGQQQQRGGSGSPAMRHTTTPTKPSAQVCRSVLANRTPSARGFVHSCPTSNATSVTATPLCIFG